MRSKLPEGWKEVELKKIGKIVTGKTPKTSKKENFGGNTPFLTPSDNMEDRFVTNTARTLSEMGVESVKNQTIPKGSVSVSCIGSQLGKVVITNENTVTNQQINSIIVNENTNNIFIYYSTLLVGKKLRYISKTSTAVPIVNKTNFSKEKILLPPLPEQKAIADTLSALDDKIELNNKTNENLEEQAQAIFKHWFIDFEFPDKHGNPYKSSGGQMIESELGMIPKGWKICNLVDEIKVTYGAPFKSKQFNEEGIGYPLIRIRDLKTFNPQHYTDEEHPRREFIKTGDVLAGMDGEFMPYIWLGPTSVLNQRVCKFESAIKGKYDNLYIYLLVKPQLIHIESYKTGTTVIHLGKRDIDSIKIIKPDHNTLREFSSMTYTFWNKIINLAEEKITLKNLRDSLLPKLMSGEIRIPLD